MPAIMKVTWLFPLVFLLASAHAQSVSSQEVDAVYPEAHALYLDLHQNPELSSHEMQTAAKLAGKLRAQGYEVTEHVGGTGIVAILKNGSGPRVMLRTELDALPVEEKTGLAYASKVHAKDDAGHDVSVMHACGHDLHMASILGTAAIMVRSKDSWHGTLMLIGQPAEETIGGARGMLADGLLKRFPKPAWPWRCMWATCYRQERWELPREFSIPMRTRCGSQFMAKVGMARRRTQRLIPL